MCTSYTDDSMLVRLKSGFKNLNPELQTGKNAEGNSGGRLPAEIIIQLSTEINDD